MSSQHLSEFFLTTRRKATITSKSTFPFFKLNHENGAAMSKNGWTVSYKLKHGLNIRPAHPTPMRLRRNENRYSHKNLCANICSNFT